MSFVSNIELIAAIITIFAGVAAIIAFFFAEGRKAFLTLVITFVVGIIIVLGAYSFSRTTSLIVKRPSSSSPTISVSIPTTVATALNPTPINLAANPTPPKSAPNPTPTTSAINPTPTQLAVPELVQRNFQVFKGTTSSIFFSSDTAPGNLIIIALTHYPSSLVSITDSQADTCNLISSKTPTGYNDYVDLYYIKDASGGRHTITASFSTSNDNNIGIYEYSGLDKGNPLYQITSNTDYSASPNGGSLTSNYNNGLYFAVGVDAGGSNNVGSAGGGYLLEDHQDDAASHERFYSEYRISPSGVYQTNFTIPLPTAWVVVAASFKP